MSSPVKSPEHKKARGDEDVADEMIDDERKSSDDAPAWARNLKNDLLAGVKETIQAEMGGVKQEMAEMKIQLDKTDATANLALKTAMEVKNSIGELALGKASANSSEFDHRLATIEEHLSKFPTKEATNNILACGGFSNGSLEPATQWINKVLGKSCNIFCKGGADDTFKGLLFIKFTGPMEAASALDSLREAMKKENLKEAHQRRLWADFEAPIETRLVKSFLFGMKRQLVEWKFAKQSIDFDIDSGTMKVESNPVLKVKVNGDDFCIEWLNDEWAKWDELQNAEETKTLIQNMKDRLGKSRAKKSKGFGKGAIS